MSYKEREDVEHKHSNSRELLCDLYNGTGDRRAAVIACYRAHGYLYLIPADYPPMAPTVPKPPRKRKARP
jgi:hypothetical protein